MGEQEIVQQIRARDQRGMEGLLLHFGPLMRYIIGPILPDPRDREECLSEVAMRVWDKIDRFDPEKGSWTAWLTALTRNAALNRSRGQAGTAGELTQDVPSPEPGPEETLLRRERLEELRRAMKNLPPGDQALLYRKYYYLQSTEQIARELGTIPRAVEGKLYRLKQKLKKRLRGGHNG